MLSAPLEAMNRKWRRVSGDGPLPERCGGVIHLLHFEWQGYYAVAPAPPGWRAKNVG